MMKTNVIISILTVAALAVQSFGQHVRLEGNPYFTTEMDTVEYLTETSSSAIPGDLPVKYTKYPHYGCTDEFTPEEQANITQENLEQMDLEALLASAAAGTLEKHPYAAQQFDDEGVDYSVPRVTVRVTVNPVLRGWRALTYALPGEAVRVTFPAGFDAEYGYDSVAVGIGLSGSFNGEDQNLLGERFSTQRMPILSRTVTVGAARGHLTDEGTTLAIGSPFGGMVYLRTWTELLEKAPFTVEVAGGVRAPIFLHNQTTSGEWATALQRAPGKLAEVRLPQLRLVLPSRYVRGVGDMAAVADWWYRAAALGEAVGLRGSGQRAMPTTLLFDECAAAESYKGAWLSQLPAEWASAAMGAPAEAAGGAGNTTLWPLLCELYRHAQGDFAPRGGAWGLAGSPTNEALAAAALILYSNAAAARSEKAVAAGAECVADPYSAFSPVYAARTRADPHAALRPYLGLMHGFGAASLARLVEAYYGRWFEEGLGARHGIERGSGDAFCLLAALTYERDMRHYCGLFNISLKKSVAEAIAALDATPFYPVFALYASAHNEAATGAPFVVPHSTPHRFDFARYLAIDPALKHTLDVRGFEKGTLARVPGRPAAYDYTPRFDPPENATFRVLVTIGKGSDATVVALDGTVVLDPRVATWARWDALDAPAAETLADAAAAAEGRLCDSKDAGPALEIPAYDDREYASLSKATGKLVVPASGYYTLFIKGDDKGAFYLRTDDSLRKLCEFTTYAGNYTLINEEGRQTLALDASRDYEFALYNLNTGGEGTASVGIAYHGPTEVANLSELTIRPIGPDMVLAPRATRDMPSPQYALPQPLYTRTPQHLGKYYQTTRDANASVARAPPRAPAAGGPLAAMIDGDPATFYHTTFPGRGGPTDFPADFVFEFSSTVELNYVRMDCSEAGNAPGRFRIYVGDSADTADTLVYEGSNTGPVLEAAFDYAKADAVRISALDNAEGNPFLAVAEVEFGITRSFALYADYWGNASERRETAPCAPQSKILKSTGGDFELSFAFTGCAFGLYAETAPEYGDIDISIQSDETDSNITGVAHLESKDRKYAQLVYSKELPLGEYTVTLTSTDPINLAFVGFDPTLPEKVLSAAGSLTPSFLLYSFSLLVALLCYFY